MKYCNVQKCIQRNCYSFIRKLCLPDKEKYFNDLQNIECSWTGRIDVDVSNAFIAEAEQQLINSIELFELGYFDCAYYSLRSAVDLSTTIVFLTDMPEDMRRDYLNAWKSVEHFPMQKQMIEKLEKQGKVYIDMKDKLPSFFSDAKELSRELNKYVHKQGLMQFYVSLNNPFSSPSLRDEYTSEFESYLKRCISVVAIMRLAIDPFPILLMDEEFLYRCFDTLTYAYSDEFVDEYIGDTLLAAYKQTNMYVGFYDSIMQKEKKSEAVFNVMKYNYVDTKKIDEIAKQFHLLSTPDIISVLLIAANEKVNTVYYLDFPIFYSTDRKSKRKQIMWPPEEYYSLIEGETVSNYPYNGVYISAFKYNNEVYFIEHNEPISAEEYEGIKKQVEVGF